MAILALPCGYKIPNSCFPFWTRLVHRTGGVGLIIQKIFLTHPICIIKLVRHCSCLLESFGNASFRSEVLFYYSYSCKFYDGKIKSLFDAYNGLYMQGDGY